MNQTTTPKKKKAITGIPASAFNAAVSDQTEPFYPEKISPVDILPEIETPSNLDIAEARSKPKIYIEEEKIYEKISFRESAIFAGLHLKKTPVIAFSEEGQKIKVWDFERKYYAFYLDEKGNPESMIEKTREVVKEFFTVLTRGNTATVFKWQNRESAWLKFNPETPGIRFIGTFISFGAAVRRIERMSSGYKIVFKSCIDFSTFRIVKMGRGPEAGYQVINDEGKLIGFIDQYNFVPVEKADNSDKLQLTTC